MDLQFNPIVGGKVFKESFNFNLNNDLQQSILSLTTCFQVSELTLSLVRCREPESYKTSPHAKALNDCAQICTTAASFLQRESDLHEIILKAAADICRKTADSLKAASDKDGIMQSCAKVCYQCADSCEKTAAIHH